MAGMVDPAKEKARLEKEKENLTGFVKSLEAKLANPGYTEKAQKDVVDKTRQMLVEKKEVKAARETPPSPEVKPVEEKPKEPKQAEAKVDP